jgi:uncharacterized protein YbjT (DUF2867 family)
MFAVMGITGQVGGAVARALLAKQKAVRAIVRSEEKGAAWAEQGCEIAVASIDDAAALQRAFAATEGVFVMLPPIFDPSPGFPEARAAIANIAQALEAAEPRKVVCLSTIGGHLERPNLLNQLHLMEERLSALPLPVCFLRPGWFMENASWDVAPARETGVVPSFLQPLGKLYPMVATEDVGSVAAELLLEDRLGRRVVELEGPRRISPNDVAAAFSKELGREVRMEVVPEDRWEALFRSQGMTNPEPRMQMLHGFNQGWIEFEGGEAHSRKGETPIDEVVRALLNRGAAQ